MFIDVGYTFLKVSAVLLLFVFSFSLGFSVLLENQEYFADMGLALVKTFVMTSGEMEYDNIFYEDQVQTGFQNFNKLFLEDCYDGSLRLDYKVLVCLFSRDLPDHHYEPACGTGCGRHPRDTERSDTQESRHASRLRTRGAEVAAKLFESEMDAGQRGFAAKYQTKLFY